MDLKPSFLIGHTEVRHSPLLYSLLILGIDTLPDMTKI